MALKTCSRTSPQAAESLRREIRALSRLDHPGVVRIRAEGIEAGVPWLAMDVLEGRTVRAWLREAHADATSVPRSASLADALTLVARLCAPLSYIHQHGVVHGDLKPENVHLTAADDVVLVDFGFHRRAGGVLRREGLDVGGTLAGTDCYMAPEQIWGELIDARADLYALGCILYEAVTGTPPFVGTLNDVIQQHLHRAPAPPSSKVGAVPEWLDALVMQLLAKRPRDRLGYADLVARRIATHLDDRPLGPSVAAPSYVYRPDLVGRDEVVADLRKVVQAAQGGRGSLTFVVGESGVGKTRLAMEIATFAVRRRMHVVLGECEAGSGEGAVLGRVALQPFRPFFAGLADRCRNGGPELTARLLGARAPILAAYEPSFAGLPGTESYPPPPDVSPEATLERLTRAVCDTLAAVGSYAPCLVVLDDVQWADDLSTRVLEVLGARGLDDVPIAVLALCRAEEVEGSLRDMIERARTPIVRLTRLEKPGVDRMVGDMLALSDPAPEFIHALFEHTEGNPFYVSEYVLVAVEQQYLRRDERGAWRVTPPRDGLASYTLPIPSTLQELLRFRLDRLPAVARRVIDVGSTLGLMFEETVLVRAAHQPDAQVMDAIDELLHRQILQRERTGGLAFAHAKIREVAYDALHEGARVEMHERAARAIETCFPDPAQLRPHFGALALHWSRVAAGRSADVAARETALAALERAAHQATDANDHQQAVRYFDEAIRLDEHASAAARVGPARRALWHRALGDAHFRLGHMREAGRDLSAALRLAGSPVPSGTLAMSGALLAAIGTQTYRRVFVQTRGRVEPRPSVDDLDEARTYDLLSFVQFLLMERAPSLLSSLRSLNRAERLAPSSALVNSSAMVGTVAGTLFGQRLGRRYFDLALETGRRLGDDLSLGRAAEMFGFYSIGQGAWSVAAASLTEAIAAFERIGDRPWRDIAVLTFANLQFMQHRPALQYYDDGLRSGIERGDIQCRTWAELGRAAELIQRGDNAAGLAALDGGDGGAPLAARFEALADMTSRLATSGARSLALYRLGAHDAALDSIRTACALLPEAPLFRYDPLPGYVFTADVSARLWESARASGSPRQRELRTLATLTYRHLRAFSRFIPIARPHAAIVGGLLLWGGGRRARAQAEWRRAIRVATHLGMPYERGLAHYELAEHGAVGGARDRHLDEAITCFEEVGTRYELDRARAASATDPSRLRSSSDAR